MCQLNTCFPVEEKLEISIDLGTNRTTRLTNDFCTVILHENTQAAMRSTELRSNISSPTAKTHRRFSITNINHIGLQALNNPYNRNIMTPASLMV